MHTMGPWKVGNKVGDTWCVVSAQPPAGYDAKSDDLQRYGGYPVARGLTLENARVVAACPDLYRLAERMAAHAANADAEVVQVLDRVFTGMPQ